MSVKFKKTHNSHEDDHQNQILYRKGARVMTILTELDGTNKADVINIFSGAYGSIFASYEIHGLQGNDTIIGGFGDDVIYGDQGNDILMGGRAIPFGGNTLHGGTGEDQLFGFFSQVGSAAAPFLPPLINTDITAACTLFGDEGNDLLVGLNGVFFVAYVSPAYNYYVAGGELFGGSGDDQLYGNYLYVNVAYTSSTSSVDALYQSVHLEGGEGNDLLVGNVGVYNPVYVNLVGLTESFQSEEDVLLGGNGDDILIGEVNVLEVTVLNSAGSSILEWGGDHLDGGQGDDVLIGDISTVSVTLIDSPDFHMELHYGADTLIGGKGNDTLVGDVQTIVNIVSQQFFADDTFVFSLSSNFGKDTIVDMNAGGVMDTLKFTDVRNVGSPALNAADVNASISAFVANGDGDLVVKFKCGGEITFQDIAYTGQSSILQVVDSAHLVIV